MTRYLLDTNHVSALLRRMSDLRQQMDAARAAAFGVSVPSIGELWYMVYNSRRVGANARNLREVLRVLTSWPFDDNAAEEFGRIRAELRRKGRPIPVIDMQVAAVARV